MEIIDLLVNYDTGAVIAILAFTSLIKTYFNIKKRYVPLVPVALGAIAGILKFFTGVDFGEITWYNAISGMLLDTIVYAGIASIVHNLYKKTLNNDKPVVTDAIKKIVK